MFQKVSVQLVSVYSEAFYSSTDHKSGAILVTKITINTAMTTTAAKTTSPLGCIIAILLNYIHFALDSIFLRSVFVTQLSQLSFRNYHYWLFR